MHLIEELFSNYGYYVLLLGLFLELIALPIPGEIMMSYCGYLVFQGKLDWFLSILFASAGVIAGITISYVLGIQLGYPFFKKYGKYLHLGPERLDKMSVWFNNFGRHVIFLTYYIPGIRHFSGYLAGITRISFKSFALNAYLGAIVWTTVFISIGRILGEKWEQFHQYTREFGIIGGILLLVVVVVYYSVKYFKKQIIAVVIDAINLAFNIFHSMGKMKAAMVVISIVFLGLIAGMIGLIQDFFAQEYIKFDELVQYMVNSLYSQSWSPFMKVFIQCTSYVAIAMVCLICLYLILEKKFDRMLEIKFMLMTIIGGEIFSKLLQFGFHRLRPVAYSEIEFIRNSQYSYPSEEVMMAVIAYGFMTFLTVRHKDNLIIRVVASTIFLITAIFSGQSVLFYGAQYPSDVLAGYIFGGVWLSLNLIMMEIYRILPRVTKHKYI